ncbi:unnamed protein product [Nezara viridula]|uniref:VPS37 C-terminal domain-containing protein n=1 Tax=Nezara viridula TaxID=85310 RepID=A0A9P0E6L7_NEZVI|nr:unnamed protein product [Nezara viridula]
MSSDNPISDYSSVIGFLTHLTTDELKSILNDDAKLDELLKEIKQGNERETEKEMLLASNRSLAEYNLSMEQDLMSHKTEVKNCTERGEEWYHRVYKKYETLITFLGHNKLDTKLDVLRLATAEIEEQSEKIAETFISGDSDVEEFLESFVSKRKSMHLNKVKSEKLSEMIQHRICLESKTVNGGWNHVNQINSIGTNGLILNNM